nr:hypothetical protein [Rodent Torque teno virus 4]
MRSSASVLILLTIYWDGVLLPALGTASPLWLQKLQNQTATVVPETAEMASTPLPGKETEARENVEKENQACTCHAMESDQQKEMYYSWVLSFTLLPRWAEGNNGLHIPCEQSNIELDGRRSAQLSNFTS